ncbi:hypothetical protein [Porphyrobacter sp. AAP60]|uniref:hypothetical protein n=1 Tax=Porphyrobacter sp. AAP60 TaxID=1523423 RepID=UPI0012E175D0|nr:hypothetical protein [Porphyrobacter sp. AAP60]
MADNRVYYDTHFPNSGHTALTLLSGQRSRGGSEAREARAAKTLRMLQLEARNFDWVILSAENFINLSPEIVARLAETITAPVEAFEAIAYVRSPVAMYASSIQQIIKGSHLFPAPDTYHRRIDRKLGDWQEFIGQDRFQVRLFERQSLGGGDVVTDFANYLSHVTSTPISLPPGSYNTSLTAEQARVMQQFRLAVYPDQPGALLPRSTALAKFFESLNAIRPVGSPVVISDLARDVIRARNADVVRALMETFPNLAFPDFTDTDTPLPEGPFPWTGDDSIEAVLSRIDGGVVVQLANLLPELNGGRDLDEQTMAAAMSGLGFHDPAERQAVRAAVEDYAKARSLCPR